MGRLKGCVTHVNHCAFFFVESRRAALDMLRSPA